MRNAFVSVVVLTMVSASAAEERPTLRDREAPRATDLLLAEKLADQARKRLELPATSRHRARWKHGGGSWGAEASESADPSDRVIINLRPPAKRRGG